MIVYRLYNIFNGMSYVGKTKKSLAQRYGKNWNKSISNSHLKGDIDRLGQECFRFEILETTDDFNELSSLERKNIDRLNSLWPNGYNLQLGGQYGKHGSSTKSKISETMKKINLHHRGVFNKLERSECKSCGKELWSYRNRGQLKASCSKDCFRKITGERVKKLRSEKIWGTKHG